KVCADGDDGEEESRPNFFPKSYSQKRIREEERKKKKKRKHDSCSAKVSREGWEEDEKMSKESLPAKRCLASQVVE
ncbi:hypothetical protein CSUI_008355, partial [Cystoisospora suis]